MRPSIVTFLSGREQCVRYRGEISEWKTLKGGVPQGTRIRPLVFLTLINNAVTDTPLTTLKYVDDLTLVETSERNVPTCKPNSTYLRGVLT